ncbi:MAG: thioredoxin domain-containing protein [Rhodospirillales bacterium]|nr:thioredoxin domain-containing protein [Rhodospirillales bacterium]
MAHNRLGEQTSPYLLQHKDNPVHWFAWGEEALALAKQLDRPILLSVGYSSCHWCHVMAHESFADAQTAALMNEHFINIKVDREERPDLDVIYQSALALMGQSGGWPLTMFLTPDAKPFWGGTYFPPEPRYGRPGFKEVLVGLSDAWRQTRTRVTKNVDVIVEALQALSQPQPGKTLDMKILDQVASGMLRTIDPALGGFRGAPKFPQTPYLKFLWRAWRRTGSALYFDAVVTSLERMAQGGIYDHLGGGFARYSTDEEWRVPHFEKMLYDNALLVSLMSEVYKETRSPLLKARVEETIDWLMREMKITDSRHNDGRFAFATALDADSAGADGHHQEGLYYIWSEDEIDAALGANAPLFKQTYGVTTQGNWIDGGDGNKGANVLVRRTAYPGAPAVETAINEARHTLLAVRHKRPRPGRDDKVLADLNGLAVQALSDAATAFARPAWLGLAQNVFAFICTTMSVDGRLKRSWTNGRAAHRAVLDDLAQMSRAALALFEATGDEGYLAQAEAWTAQADDLFWCDSDGGYCLSARDATDVITRSRVCADNALPNGNGTMADVLARLYLITGQEGYRAKAHALINAFPAESPDAIANMPTLLVAYELLATGAQVVVVGSDATTQAQPLIDAALTAPGSLRVILRADGDTTLPGHPAFGKTALAGQAAVYVCRDGVCHEPVTDVASLRKALEGL